MASLAAAVGRDVNDPQAHGHREPLAGIRNLKDTSLPRLPTKGRHRQPAPGAELLATLETWHGGACMVGLALAQGTAYRGRASSTL